MRKGIFYILLGVFFIGIQSLFNKLALDTGINPTVFTTIRLLITAIIMVGIVFVGRKKIDQLKKLTNWKDIAVIGIIGVIVAKLSSMWGLSMITLSERTLIAGTGLIFAVILSYFILGERLSKKFFVFAVGIIAGVIILIWPLENFVLNLGYILTILSTLCYAISHVWVRKCYKKISAVNLNFGRYIIGCLGLVPIMLLTAYDQIPTIMNGWPYVLAAAITATAGAIFSFKGMQKEGASMHSSLTSMKRIWIVVLSMVFLGDLLSPQIIFGGGIIIACAYFISQTKVKFLGEKI